MHEHRLRASPAVPAQPLERELEHRAHGGVLAMLIQLN
jgi:hypothetical protein